MQNQDANLRPKTSALFYDTTGVQLLGAPALLGAPTFRSTIGAPAPEI